MCEFRECPVCQAKPGTPELCESCLHNRDTIARLTARLDDREERLREKDEPDSCPQRQITVMADKHGVTIPGGRLVIVVPGKPDPVELVFRQLSEAIQYVQSGGE